MELQTVLSLQLFTKTKHQISDVNMSQKVNNNCR